MWKRWTSAALALVGAAFLIVSGFKEPVYDVMAADGTTAVTSGSTEADAEVPQIGDHINVIGPEINYYANDGKFRAVIRTKPDVYIIERYDENYWRVNIPYLNQPERVLLLDVSNDIMVIDHDGYILGDICRDGTVDILDLCMLRELVIDDFSDLDDYSDIPRLIDRSWQRQLADVNSDAEVSVADVVCMSKFILGEQERFVMPDEREPYTLSYSQKK